MNWRKHLKGKVKFNAPLKKYTTFKIGGPAKFLIEPAGIADLRLLVAAAGKEKLPILLLGAGSNILASGQGLKAMVLHLNSSPFKKISSQHGRLSAGSALLISRLIAWARKKNLTGLEFLAGIPGTVGGALMMNAGAWGKQIGDLVEKVKVMDYNGKIKTLGRKRIKFQYRKSNLGKFIILSATFRLSKGNKNEIRDKLTRYLRQRRFTQEMALPNAGCVFRNPPKESAGRLIDLCALKGSRVGRASISKRHANFIINEGNASSGDVLKLMALMRKKVKDKFGINLEPEIKIWE